MEDFLPVPSTEHMEHSPSMQLSLDPSDSDVPRTAGPRCQLGKQVGAGPVIALEYTGDACLSSCQEVAKAIATETGSTGLVYVSSQANSALRQIEAVFGAAASRGLQ
ncbi:hypothetical protein IscW_ISCW018533 [Ixodes scapularis]|uniref:Uncharacterized protein n=1 Tax=Ixodes scapularis TaxID=6945 RepID=B7PQ05_IXOSC|nr:hypothetical protein IscW_ISCW018533 [Ixodes scapularis]|eukprot:XP_002435847.1 hypothetical protein IscW_ISCW018533 [Ixodes scapularis]